MEMVVAAIEEGEHEERAGKKSYDAVPSLSLHSIECYPLIIITIQSTYGGHLVKGPPHGSERAGRHEGESGDGEVPVAWP